MTLVAPETRTRRRWYITAAAMILAVFAALFGSPQMAQAAQYTTVTGWTYSTDGGGGAQGTITWLGQSNYVANWKVRDYAPDGRSPRVSISAITVGSQYVDTDTYTCYGGGGAVCTFGSGASNYYIVEIRVQVCNTNTLCGYRYYRNPNS